MCQNRNVTASRAPPQAIGLQRRASAPIEPGRPSRATNRFWTVDANTSRRNAPRPSTIAGTLPDREAAVVAIVAAHEAPPMATSATNPIVVSRLARPSSSADSSSRRASGAPNIRPGTTAATRDTPVDATASRAVVGRTESAAGRPQPRATRHWTRSSAMPTTPHAMVNEMSSHMPAEVSGCQPGSRSENTSP